MQETPPALSGQLLLNFARMYLDVKEIILHPGDGEAITMPDANLAALRISDDVYHLVGQRFEVSHFGIMPGQQPDSPYSFGMKLLLVDGINPHTDMHHKEARFAGATLVVKGEMSKDKALHMIRTLALHPDPMVKSEKLPLSHSENTTVYSKSS